MSEQNESRAEKARERFLAKQKQANEKKSIKPLPIAIGIAVFFAFLAILFATNIAKMHKDLSEENAISDMQTMSQLGTFDWDSTLKDAPWAIVNCPTGDFVVTSSRAIPSSNIQNCTYRVANDIRLEALGNIWSPNGRVRFYVPEQ